jgi:hypothetical protein
MVECYINLKCQLFIVVLLESELGVGDFTIDLLKFFLKIYVANSMTFSQKTQKIG